MKLIKLQCPNCGATFTVTEGSATAVCEYCGATVAVSRTEAEVTVVRRKFNRKAFIVFGIIAAVLIVAAAVIILSVTSGDPIDPRAYKAAGVYLVGTDIPEGEYILYPNVSKQDGDVTPVLEVRKTREAATNKSDFLYRKEFYMRQYVNLHNGEYIAFEHSLLYLPDKVTLKPLDADGYSPAQLKVGVDIAAGEYVIAGNNKQTQYFITSKPEAELYGTSAINSPDMLSFGYCENRVYLKVKDGEYLSFVGGKLYKSCSAPSPVPNADGALPPGQYKVGVDIESGRYSVCPAENKESQAWICLNKNSVKTTSVSSWETEIINAGGETLMFIRFDAPDVPADLTVPNPDNADLYITFWYCFATEI